MFIPAHGSSCLGFELTRAYAGLLPVDAPNTVLGMLADGRFSPVHALGGASS
jgi:hypothetical protein